MQSSTVRIDHESRAILQEIAREEKESQLRIIQKALENYRRRLFLKKYREAYAALKSDEKAWDEEAAERKMWEPAIADGLEKDK